MTQTASHSFISQGVEIAGQMGFLGLLGLSI
jgi:hypothetical protein